ncbi:MAG: restriction endonuclease subunit S [Candidatus Cloacimonetes bacterium]|nr:restriction endonuclease subunit S [Candidatus Cloacimonadota bacterium]MCK9333661.1 restriction endonuclease subunit S [Candidatus Cloacimonadota bacterium]MDY0228524.1 restriction endonuclease subunit S [Candidatus Cloacimonadaceae bacterium]
MELLQKYFDAALESPDGIKKLRELILTLAMQGKLFHPSCSVNNEWKQGKLGDIFEFEYGKSLPSSMRSNTGEYPVFGSNGIVGTHQEALVMAPCLIIGRKGSAGAITLSNHKGCFVTDVAFYCVPNPSVDLKFAYHFLQSMKLPSLSKGIKPGINRNEVYNLRVMIPPLNEQTRIVAKIDHLMSICDKLEELQQQKASTILSAHSASIKLLLTSANADELASCWQFITQHFDAFYTTIENVDELKKAIVKLAMQGKLVPQDSNDEPASELLKTIQAEKIRLKQQGKFRSFKVKSTDSPEKTKRNLPISWGSLDITECYYMLGGRINQVQTSEYLPVGKYPVIDQGKTFIAGYSDRVESVLQTPHDVVVFGDHTRNFKYIDFDFIIGADGVKVMCPYTSIFPRYFYYSLLSLSIRDRGYARHFKVLNENVLPIPPINEQKRIVGKIDQLNEICDTLVDQIQKSTVKQTEILDSVFSQAVVV